jgi:hypothetical protein
VCMLHKPVPHVPLSYIPHHRHDINQDILLDAGEAIERGVCAPRSDLAILYSKESCTVQKVVVLCICQ